MNMLDGVKVIYILYWIAVVILIWAFERKIIKLETENQELKEKLKKRRKSIAKNGAIAKDIKEGEANA